ncbi:MAG: cytochrome c biogenesis protein DipZ [Actinobacteria bacterium]|nr:cytochrome c biogenesis protein DipZ [Actinomycetota bacterium]
MLVLIAIGLVAGFVTAVSPCVLPVLPILFAGGATGSRRRPLAIIGGLIVSFSAFTLGGVWLLDELGLPKDFLRDVAIVLLFVVAATLVFPRVGQIVERPLYRLSRRPAGDLGGGFLLGVSLGLVFVPCASPVLAAITVLGATNEVGGRAIVLTTAYSLGAAIPMLGIAYGGTAVMKRLRPQAQNVRRALGVVVALTALAIAFNLDRHLQTAVPDYVKSIQDRVERSDRGERELAKVRGATRETSAGLRDYGAAPGFTGIRQWINTPGERPLSIAGLRGKVVLVDFWTYSCINCLRTFPHLRAWDRTYRAQGLVTIGVHTPEFAFEQVEGNVRSAVKRLDLDYPIAMDNDFGTWNAFQNRYWPAKYLIDARGHIRYAHFGEGAYETTESHIRALLAERKDDLPAPVQIADRTPKARYTPETYLGYERLSPEQFAGDSLAPDDAADYRFPRRPLTANQIAYAGQMTVEPQRLVAGLGARLRLRFQAQVVHLVLGGQGSLEVFLDGRKLKTVRIDGSRLYTLLSLPRVRQGLLELRFAPGISVYAFTFG